VEATRNWYWLYELLEDQGVTVKLADARKVRLIAESQLKNDKVDPRSLAQLERTGFLPEAYIPPRAIRDNREYLRYLVDDLERRIVWRPKRSSCN
jgi:transposase